MLRAASFALAVLLLQPATAFHADASIACDSCAAWNAAQAPFRVFGNTYYVGVAGLSSILVASNDGLVLLDGALPQSAAVIDAHIRALGFRTEDIRLILNSHAHYDHAGGIAALERASGARAAASAKGKQALEGGRPTPDDPQFLIPGNGFPPVRGVRSVGDGEILRVGDAAITAHLTPGHTPGSTTWSWRSCEGPRCLDVVYADSLTAVSADGFRFTGDAAHPGIVESFRRSIATVAHLPCDILLTPHPDVFGLKTKFAARAADPSRNPFIDAAACRAYAAAAAAGLDRRIAGE